MIPRLLLILLVTATLSAQSADLVVNITTSPYDANDQIDVVVEVETRIPLRNSEVITLDIFGSFEQHSWSAGPGLTCEHRVRNWLQCSVAPMEAGGKASLSFHGVPITDLSNRFVMAELTWRDAGWRPEKRSFRKDVVRFTRSYTVTHTGDSAAGSLRDAIDDAVEHCRTAGSACLIRFNLGPDAVIRPVRPLPLLRAAGLTIDGESNVTIDGSLLTDPANGLTGGATIRNLTIRSFPENGIEAAGPAVIEGCRILDNGSRGIVQLFNATLEVRDSIISGNGRSGIFQAAGQAIIERNLIGIAPDGFTPMPNGASGVYAGRTYSMTLRDNVIAFNGHFGVAFPRENLDVDVDRNRIIGNRAGQIDIDLDGPTVFAHPARYYGEGPMDGPALLSATYDPATDSTTVTGRLQFTQAYWIKYELLFYSTTAANEADRYLGAIQLAKPDFTVTFPGDLRGRFITANTIRSVNDEWTDRGTSELAAPIEVR